MRVLFSVLTAALLSTTFATASDADATPPPFFLQDPSDNLCLSGEDFKRCSIETLWYGHGRYFTAKKDRVFGYFFHIQYILILSLSPGSLWMADGPCFYGCGHNDDIVKANLLFSY